MMKNLMKFAACAGLLTLAACDSGKSCPEEFPYMGQGIEVEKEVEGKKVVETLPHKIAPFSVVNQKGKTLTNETLKGNIYIADFFFTSCPSICPKVKKQMKRVYEQYKDLPNFKILSHTIDPVRDTVERLDWYATRLGVKDDKSWHFVTAGEQEVVFKMAYNYLVSAVEDDEAPGGFDHSGYIALVDKDGHIRGMYDGLIEERVDDMIREINCLYEQSK